MSATSVNRTTSPLPWMTRSTLPAMRSKETWKSEKSRGVRARLAVFDALLVVDLVVVFFMYG
jgi:hypothetical protein